MQFNAILCLCYNSMQFRNYKCNFSQKRRFWANILCNLMQFFLKKDFWLIFKNLINATLWISCNSIQFYLKKDYFSYFYSLKERP